MTARSFQAMVVTEVEPRRFERAIATRSTDDLPPGDLLVRVGYSSLNYKDALSAAGRPGVTRNYPHTPGIDAAGTIEEIVDSALDGGPRGETAGDRFAPGDQVVIIGHDLGMDTPGGFGGYVRVPAAWAVKLPAGLTARKSMIYGTAGFTAAMSIDKIVAHGVAPEDGEILVTGATGGVGSFGVALAAHLGYAVVAVTGKVEEAGDYLRDLGAGEVISREEAIDDSGRPLLRGRWAAVIDTVGGDILASALKSTRPNAAIAACGLAASPALPTTVLPFILRGNVLYGINSAPVSPEERRRLWQRLAGEWKLPDLDRFAREVPLAELDPEIDRILAGGQTGRVLVRLP
jgi:putative YhdH/YhfP family quinone oxidoreductase